jgi:uncharacterized lipoprotein YmbA
MKKLLIISLLALAACSSPKIGEPTIELPKAPAALMIPPQNLEPIKEEKVENNNKDD